MSKAVKLTKQTIAIITVMIVLGAGTGVFIGVWWIRNLAGGPTVDYSLYDSTAYREAQGSLDEDYFRAFLNPTSAQLNGENIQQLFLAAQKNSQTAESYTLKSNGLVSTIVQQEIRGYKKYNANSSGYKFYGESFSRGARSVVELTTFSEVGQISVKTGRFADNVQFDDFMSGNLGNYLDAEVIGYTGEEYAEKYGLPVLNLCPYIVSTPTLIDKENDKQTFKKVTLENGNEGYSFRLTLDRVYAVLDYAKQMKAVSGLSDLPSFTKDVIIDVTLTVLDDGRIVFYQNSIEEHYNMKFGAISPRCDGKLNQLFDFVSEVNIPQQ